MIKAINGLFDKILPYDPSYAPIIIKFLQDF